jgi:hypothetical protein
MNLKIVKCPDKDFKPYIISAVQFYGKHLIPSKRLRENISITIKFNSKLNYWGLAYIDEFDLHPNRPREFVVEIHPWLGAALILKTLAHEMVHIKQYAKCEINDSLSKWKGQRIDSDNLDYYSHPWEMEAYSMEVGLFTKYAVKEKLWEVFADVSNPDAEIVKKEINWKKS